VHVDIKQVKAKLRANYNRIIRFKATREPERSGERALLPSSGGFKGNCRSCGEYEHRAVNGKKKEESKETLTAKTQITRAKKSSALSVIASDKPWISAEKAENQSQEKKGHWKSLWLLNKTQKKVFCGSVTQAYQVT
jgi:hypothetical protein